MPFLLRKKEETTDECYELVGFSYIHGVMDGEIPIEKPQTIVIVQTSVGRVLANISRSGRIRMRGSLPGSSSIDWVH